MMSRLIIAALICANGASAAALYNPNVNGLGSGSNVNSAVRDGKVPYGQINFPFVMPNFEPIWKSASQFPYRMASSAGSLFSGGYNMLRSVPSYAYTGARYLTDRLTPVFGAQPGLRGFAADESANRYAANYQNSLRGINSDDRLAAHLANTAPGRNQMNYNPVAAVTADRTSLPAREEIQLPKGTIADREVPVENL